MTGKQVGQVENIAVNPQGSFQLNSLLADYAPGVNQGYARVFASNAEPFITYAVIIDGARPGERTVAFPWCTEKRNASSLRLKWLPGSLQMDIAELRW